MKTYVPWFAAALIGASFACSPAFAGAEKSSVSSFKAMEKVVESFGAQGIPHTLVVMDDDDTLTMMPCSDPMDPRRCQYLGGPAWFAWQQALLEKQPESRYLVANSFDDLLDVSALLFDLNRMAYTEGDVPSVLNALTQKQVRDGDAYAKKYPDRWMNIPQDELRKRIGEIPPGKDLILLCNTGVRSYEAQLNLRDMGLTDPVSVQGGIVTLNKCGLDL